MKPNQFIFLRYANLSQKRNFITKLSNLKRANMAQNDPMKLRYRFLSYPSHILVPMPALSPTMETGSISKWLLKEGEKFSTGQAICEVETDKASVTYEATDDGFLAKILADTGELKVGAPMMITVSEESDIAAFATYTTGPAAVAATPAAAPVKAPTPSPPTAPAIAAAPTPTPSSQPSGRIFASPFARKLASEASIPIASLFPGSGPNGRVIAADVATAKVSRPATAVATPAAPVAVTSAPVSPPVAGLPLTGGAFVDFAVSPMSQALAAQLTIAKQTIPHYYLSIELNLSKLMELRGQLNCALAGAKSPVVISVQDIIVKAAAVAVKQVPDVNASWFEEGFVRRYEKVDVNIVMTDVNGADGVFAPVLKDVAGKGLSQIAKEVADFQSDVANKKVSDKLVGTISVHNLGIFGVRSCAPIVLPPQACALALGAVVDTVVPKANAKDGEDNWEVAPVLIATLSCDHRVVDGAVGAQYLSAFKALVENPTTMLM